MKKTSLKLEVYNSILEKIATCIYAPGSILNEDSLTEEYGVSRTPIRDAISRLEQEGLVTILPKKGVVVSPITMTVLNSIYETRMLIEPYVLENYGSSINDEKIRYFYNEISNLNTSNISGFDIDDSFHDYLVSLLPNIYIKKMYRLLQTQNSRLRILSGTYSENRLRQGHIEHLEILKNCLTHNWKEAANAMRTHLINSKDCSFETMIKNKLI